MLLYNRLAGCYFNIEMLGRNFQEEIASLCGLLRNNGVRDVLDLGCGSGEHIDALVRMGFRAEGLDESEFMLKIAGRRFKNATFYQGNIKNFQADRLYDAAICIFGSFNYFLKNEEISLALKNIYRLLRPTGVLILEIWNAAPVIKIGKKELSPAVKIEYKGKTIERERGFVVLSRSPTIVQVNYIYRINGKKMYDRHFMRAYEPEEIKTFVQKAGFRIDGTFSHLNGRYYSENSNRIVLLLSSR